MSTEEPAEQGGPEGLVRQRLPDWGGGLLGGQLQKNRGKTLSPSKISNFKMCIPRFSDFPPTLKCTHGGLEVSTYTESHNWQLQISYLLLPTHILIASYVPAVLRKCVLQM